MNPSQSGAATGRKIKPNPRLARLLAEEAGVNAYECFQCEKCSAGCPVNGVTDLVPHQVVRMVMLGMADELMASRMIWLCVGCETCLTRCPNSIDVPALMDGLRRQAVIEKMPLAEPDIEKFHRSFLSSVRMFGRSYELGMMGQYKMLTRDLFKDAKLGLDLFLRGKLPLLPQGIDGKPEVKRYFDNAAKRGAKS